MSDASTIELAFTTAAIAGVFLRSWALYEAFCDWRHADDRITRLLGFRDVVNEATGMVVKSCFVVIGVWAMRTPPTESPRPSTFNTVAGLVLIGVVVLWDTNSALGAWIRRRVRDNA